MSSFNDQVIADFNQHGGKPGGYFEGAPVLLLHSIGAKSGAERTHPDLDISVGDGKTISRVPVHARILEGRERNEVYGRQAALFPQFADYAQKTTRDVIPVIELSAR
jgi:hypothetical protein